MKSGMQNKLLSGSQKNHHHEMRKGGCWFWFNRMKGSHKTKSKRKAYFVFTVLTIMFFTALIWSYEPHLVSSSSPQEPFGLRTPAASHRVTIKQEDVFLREPHLIRAETKEKSKPLTSNVEKTNHGSENVAENSSTKQWSSIVKGSSNIEGSFSSKKDDKQETVDKDTFPSKWSSTTRGSSQSTTVEGFSTTKGSYDTEGSLARKKKVKDSPSFESKNQETTNKPNLVAESLPNTKLMVEESSTSKGYSTTQGSSKSFTTIEELSATKGSNDIGGSLTREKEENGFSFPTAKKTGTVDTSKPVIENVQNTKLVVDEPFTSKGYSSTTQDSSQSFDATEGLSATKGSDITESSLITEKDSKVDKPKPITENVQNTTLMVEESSTLKGSSTTRSSSQSSATTERLSATKDSDNGEASLAREKEDNDSSSSASKTKEDTTQLEDLHVQESLLTEDKETKDKPKSQSNNDENAKPFVKQSFASNDSSIGEEILQTGKEDKVATSTFEKKATQASKDVAKIEDGSIHEPLVTHREAENKPKIQVGIIEYKKPVTSESFEGHFASTDPSPTKESSRRGQKFKVTTIANENKEISKDIARSKDGSVKEPTSIRKEMDDKQNAQINNVQSEQQVANKSLVIKESSTTQDKSLPKESAAADGSLNSIGLIRRKKQDKVVTSISQNKECNYAKGRWVFDSRRPLYSGFKCKSWLSWMFACRLTTRTDFRFEQFRWQPENCDMPEFERHLFLKRMKNKTIAFVGDSIGRQQFQSFMCMLTGGEDNTQVEDVGLEYDIRPKNMAYRFPQTNTTIIYYWSSCLCDLTLINTSDPSAGVAMHLDRPPVFLKENLHKFDVLILNTGHHWNRGKLKVNKWVMHVNGKPNMDKTLFTMGSAKNFTVFNIAKWVDSQLKSHPRGLKVFFRTISPKHFSGGEGNTGGSCENTTPLVHGTQVTQEESSDELVANAIKGTGVKLLDITALSALRDEGHVSKYGHKANSGVHDCLYWCLPGIPDTWNEIMVAQI